MADAGEPAAHNRRSLHAVPGGQSAGPDGRSAVGTETLLARVAKGDQDAFAALYDRAAGQVYG